MARKLIVEIVGDSRSYERALNKSATSTQKFGQAMGSTSPKVGKLSSVMGAAGTSGALLTGVAVGLAFKLGGDAVSAASALNEQISRTEVVMGASSDEMIAWSETTAQAMGISQRAALAAAGTFAGLFQTVGVQRQEAGQLSQALVQLASDLASLQDTSTDEALTALRSGLAGEAEPLRRFNIFLSETRVQQQALIETGKKNIQSLSQQEKTLARYTLIMKDSTLAQGNFALTADDLANRQRKTGAEMENLSANVGQVLVPAMDAAVGVMGLFAQSLNDAIDGMEDLRGWIDDSGDMFDGWNSAVEEASAGIGGFFEDIRDGLDKTLGIARLTSDIRDLRNAVVGEGAAAPTVVPSSVAPGEAGDVERAVAEATAAAEAARVKFGKEIVGQITKQAAAQSDLNKQLANSEARAAHLRDLIIADPGNVKLQQRLTAELKKQSGIRGQIASSAKADAAAAKSAADAAKRAAEAAKEAARARLMATLDLGEAQAQLTKGLKDDLAAAKTRESTLRRLVSLNRDDLDLQNQLVQATIARRDVEQQINAQREERVKSAQFKELGLTGAGDELTPGAGSLLKRATSLQQQVKGTIFDTPKTKTQLKKIVAFLKENLKGAKKDVRAAILDMLNGISDGFDEKKGPLTKTSGLNTKKILAGMGLTPEEERELRQRLSHLGSGGQGLAAPGGGAKTRGARGGFGINDPIFVESHTTINLDGQRVANVVTKQQQKTRRRNPGQKRGPNVRH